jgi:type IV pilus assembly protein PilQ
VIELCALVLLSWSLPAVAVTAVGQEREAVKALSRAPKPTRSPLVIVSEPARRRWQGEKISLSLKDADLVEVLRSFARLAEINLVVDPKVKGEVTVELHDVPWDHALSVILKTHGLGAELDGRVLSVATPGP